jgi:hypothetical protein
MGVLYQRKRCPHLQLKSYPYLCLRGFTKEAAIVSPEAVAMQENANPL